MRVELTPTRMTRKPSSVYGRYFTGKPCINGHIAERYVRSNRCVACSEKLNHEGPNPERKKVYGIGVNDADYQVYKKVNGKTVKCPYYKVWSSMLERGYSERLKTKFPTYRNVRVSPEWFSFSMFREWMEGQYWEGLQLDKDILSRGGEKLYSPDTCAFIPRYLNAFLNTHDQRVNEYPLGVNATTMCNRRVTQKYTALISKGGKRLHLGYFDAPDIAHQHWQKAKAESIDVVLDRYKTEPFCLEKVCIALSNVKYNILEDAANGRETKYFDNSHPSEKHETSQ